MSLLFLASALAANVVAAADIDLASSSVFMSADARAAVADGTVTKLICLDVSGRSSKFQSACLTSAEWHKAVELSRLTSRNKRPSGGIHGLLPQPLPSQLSPPRHSSVLPNPRR